MIIMINVNLIYLDHSGPPHLRLRYDAAWALLELRLGLGRVRVGTEGLELELGLG